MKPFNPTNHIMYYLHTFRNISQQRRRRLSRTCITHVKYNMVLLRLSKLRVNYIILLLLFHEE